MHASLQPRTAIGSRSLSQSAMKSRSSAYGSMLMRKDPLARSVTASAAQSELETLVAKYNLIYEVSHTAKREMAQRKSEIADLRAGVGSYQTLLDMGLEALKTDLWNQLNADRSALEQELSEGEGFRQMLAGEVRQINLDMRHTQTVIRDCQRRITGLEGFTGVGRRS